MQLSNRTFLISGGSSGLGLSTALTLLSANANVSILDLNPPPPSTHPLLSDSSRTLFTQTDVSSSDSLSAAVTATVQWSASHSSPLSGVVCCAGIGTAALILPKQPENASLSTVKHMDMKIFDRTLSINLRGTVDLMRLAIPYMSLNEPWGPDGERGIAIIVSSVAAYEGQVGQLAYSASKGAVASIVLPLARELGQKAGIRVLGIAPGVFQTGMTVPPKPKAEPAKSKAEAGSSSDSGKKKRAPTGQRAGINPEMVNYPTRMGKGEEFGRLVKDMIENPMLNGIVVRLDGGVRMPSRL